MEIITRSTTLEAPSDREKRAERMSSLIKRDRLETLLKALLESNKETREFDFQVDVFTTGDVRLYSPKLREWLKCQ